MHENAAATARDQDGVTSDQEGSYPELVLGTTWRYWVRCVIEGVR